MCSARVEETLLSLYEQKPLFDHLRKEVLLYNRSRLPLLCGTNSEKSKKTLLRENPQRQQKSCSKKKKIVRKNVPLLVLDDRK